MNHFKAADTSGVIVCMVFGIVLISLEFRKNQNINIYANNAYRTNPYIIEQVPTKSLTARFSNQPLGATLVTKAWFV